MTQPLIQKNILVIGGTGTGKSSFLNNLALVLRFATLEEAENGRTSFVPPIPVQMVFNNVSIVDGQDENERSDQASSRTQRPQVYSIRYGNLVINIIDTPGVADLGDSDNMQVKYITTCMYQFQEIHGIMAFLKSTDNTLNDSFKYTLNLILSCLGKTAGKLISFVITHAGYNKDPGAAPNVIEKFLNDLRNNPGIEYSNDHLYCIENSSLFYVLSTEKGVVCDPRDKVVYQWTYENNVDEFKRFLTNVINNQNSYKLEDVQTLMLAKQTLEALASLLPSLDTRGAEIQAELDRLENQLLALRSQYARHETQLMKVREWREEIPVTKTRVVDKMEIVTKQRIIQEEYMDTVVDLDEYDISATELKGTLAGGSAAVGSTGTARTGPTGAPGSTGKTDSNALKFRKVTKQVKKTRPKVEVYEELVTVPVEEEYQDIEYRDRVTVEEDLVVKEKLNKLQKEKTKTQNLLSEMSSLYQKFQEEKDLVVRFLCDLASYVKQYGMVAIDDSALGPSEIFTRIAELKISSERSQGSSIIGVDELLARLTTMQDLEHFGAQTKNILREYKNLGHGQYRVVSIQVDTNNAFLNRILQEN